jgi:uncharacterized membrane protein YagU involved in acid resistance
MTLPAYRRIAAGALAGFLGALTTLFLPSGIGANPFVSAVSGTAAGALFAAALGSRPLGPGAALVWGLGGTFVLWMAGCALDLITSGAPHGGSMFDVARDHFAAFVGLSLTAVPFGFLVGTFGARADPGRVRLRIARALCAGGFAGIVGGWAFGKWMEQAGFFPLIAGIVGSRSAHVGAALHFAIAMVIGASFGLLFQREIRGVGSSLGWGAAYGVLWWFLGPLTLLPLLEGARPDWSVAHAAGLFGSLVGHIIYGIIVGLLYAFVDDLWRWLFERSDPLNRQAEGAGMLALSSIGRGAAASLAGGLLFSVVMVETGQLSRVAQLVGAHSSAAGFLVHLAISALIGASYGIFFHDEATDDAIALAWGALYGLIWWFLGPLTLFPILLGGQFTWTTVAASEQVPSLLGHILYGMGLAVAFRVLERRHLAHLFIDARLRKLWLRRRRPAGTPTPALLLFFIAAGTLLPIILS